MSKWWLLLSLPVLASACTGGSKDDDDDDDDDTEDTTPWWSLTTEEDTSEDTADRRDDTADRRDDTGGRRSATNVAAPFVFDDGTLNGVRSCDGSTVRFEFDFLGDASGGAIDMADSAHAPNSWNETHTLDAVAFASGLTELATPFIPTRVGIDEHGDGVGTLFTCSDHFEGPRVMTYIARAYDLDGDLVDCVAWGHDPSGFIDGEYATFNARPDEAEITAANCRTVAGAR